MKKGPAPTYSDDVLRHAIVGIVKVYPRISPESLRSELYGTASVGRITNLIKQSVTWDGNRWSLHVKTNLPDSLRDPLPSLVSTVKDDLKNDIKPMDIAVKRGIAYSTVLGVKRGRYDGMLKTPRNSHGFVMVNGMLKLYDEKGYEPSGKSIKGALEVSDDSEQLRCHECGDWFENLALHIRYEHRMKTRDYKKAHSLNLGAALIGEAQRIKMICAAAKQGNNHLTAARATRAAMIAAGTGGIGTKPPGLTRGGVANLRGNCAAQLTADLRILADRLGHIPSQSETKRAGICFEAVRYRFGNVKAALKTAGVNIPEKKSGQPRWYTDEQLILMLKAFYAKHKRPPFRSDLRRGLLPSDRTFQKRFGSWNNALVKAGMRPNVKGWTGIRLAKRAKNLAVKSRTRYP